MPNLRGKTWTTTTPAQVTDAQFWEDHLISDSDAEFIAEIRSEGGGLGHDIVNDDGQTMPKEKKLQFLNAEVTDDPTNQTTIVDAKGAKGDAATIQIGTVESVPSTAQAEVTNSGTSKDAVFNFKIPRGASGGVWGNISGDILDQTDLQTEINTKALKTGGSTNQVLTKDSATDYDASWKTLSAANTSYSKTSSGLAATTVQGAIDEVDSKVDSLSSSVSTLNDRYNKTLSSPNLNDVTYNYHGYVTSATNIPSGVGTSGQLIVNANSTGKYVMQIYSQYNGANVYTRSCNNGTWTSWVKMTVADDIGKQVLSWQRVNVSYTNTVADKDTATLTGTMTAVSGATDYILIAERINFGFFTANPTRSGTTISCVGMNASGTAHTLSGTVVVIALK
ncbi:MAG: hypothetical protein J6N95_05655 [Bacilli bacterium]|nr:hypothetical protein [Bacilli bacterium]